VALSLVQRILDKALLRGEQRAKAFCRSRQLRKSMNRRVLQSTINFAKGIINVPQYWAIYYHSKRAIIHPNSKSCLVWFRDPKDDPRLVNGESPMYKSQVRGLTKGEWKKWKKKNAEAKAANQPVPMIITKRSPFKTVGVSWYGNPFFSNGPGGGMERLGKEVGRIAEQEVYAEMERFLKSSGLKNKMIVKNV